MTGKQNSVGCCKRQLCKYDTSSIACIRALSFMKGQAAFVDKENLPVAFEPICNSRYWRRWGICAVE